MEIEIKLRLPAQLAPVRRKLRTAGFRISERRMLEDNVLFDDDNLTLGKQGKLVRVRRLGRHAKLTYKGPSQPGPYKSRPEIETDLGDPKHFEEILEQICYHPIFRYEKYRTEFVQAKSVGTVMLDETPIGNFLELEGGPRWIDRTAKTLGFEPSKYVTSSYGALYLEYCQEHGLSATNMLFSVLKQRGLK